MMGQSCVAALAWFIVEIALRCATTELPRRGDGLGSRVGCLESAAEILLDHAFSELLSIDQNYIAHLIGRERPQ